MAKPDHAKKMAAPIVITALFLVYLFVYGAAILMTAPPPTVMLLFAVPIVGLGVGMIYVLITRINEIRSGEEDDLDNY